VLKGGVPSRRVKPKKGLPEGGIIEGFPGLDPKTPKHEVEKGKVTKPSREKRVGRKEVWHHRDPQYIERTGGGSLKKDGGERGERRQSNLYLVIQTKKKKKGKIGKKPFDPSERQIQTRVRYALHSLCGKKAPPEREKFQSEKRSSRWA